MAWGADEGNMNFGFVCNRVAVVVRQEGGSA